MKELAINLSKIFEEVEDITENTTILDDSVQIEYPAIFDVAENTGNLRSSNISSLLFTIVMLFINKKLSFSVQVLKFKLRYGYIL